MEDGDLASWLDDVRPGFSAYVSVLQTYGVSQISDINDIETDDAIALGRRLLQSSEPPPPLHLKKLLKSLCRHLPPSQGNSSRSTALGST